MLGWSLREKGNLDDAAKEVHEALGLDASNAAAHEVLAAILLLQGKTDEGLAEARESVRLDPKPHVGI